jgi:hypothetical protein
MTRRRRSRTRLRIALTAGVVLGVTLSTPGAAPAGDAPTYSESATRATTCRQVDHGFTPRWLRIPHIIGPTRVLALGRDRNGTPRTPPLTDRGKWQFAWDKESGIRPGGRRGVVRLNAHTYPWDGSYGSALGNRLLRRLRVGARLVVSGRDRERLCYRVVRRVRVRADRSLPGYYSSTGRPRLAILVCSGKRRGPGDWSHRTIWYAVPKPAVTYRAE